MTAIPDLNEVTTVVNAPAVQAIAWALVQFVWQGALIGALAAITLAALRRSAADVRYVVATIALSLMLTVPVVTAMQTFNARQAVPASATAVASSATEVTARSTAGTMLAPSVPATSPGKMPATLAGTVPGTVSPERTTMFEASTLQPLAAWLLLGLDSRRVRPHCAPVHRMALDPSAEDARRSSRAAVPVSQRLAVSRVSSTCRAWCGYWSLRSSRFRPSSAG